MKIDDFIDLLPRGIENRRPAEEIARLLDSDKRGVRQLAYKARKQGIPVCSSCEVDGGYWLPDSPSDAVQYLCEQRARIRSANIAIRAVERFIERQGGTL